MFFNSVKPIWVYNISKNRQPAVFSVSIAFLYAYECYILTCGFAFTKIYIAIQTPLGIRLYFSVYYMANCIIFNRWQHLSPVWIEQYNKYDSSL